MATVRVKPDVACVVFYEGEAVTLAPGKNFDRTDPFVRAHPDYFDFDDTSPAPQTPRSVVVGPDAPVEEAMAIPGQRRNR